MTQGSQREKNRKQCICPGCEFLCCYAVKVNCNNCHLHGGPVTKCEAFESKQGEVEP
jgi:hypothetical protein